MRLIRRPAGGEESTVPILRSGRPPGVIARADALSDTQPLPKVLPALDFAPFDDDGDDNVLPAFDSADLLGLPILLTPFRGSYHVCGPRGGATSSSRL